MGAAATAGAIDLPELSRYAQNDMARAATASSATAVNTVLLFSVPGDMECWIFYITMKRSGSLFLLMLAGLPLCAQQTLRLSLQQAIALATSPRGSAAVQLAEAAAAGAKARVEQAHALRYPLLTGTVSESNLTRNLGAEGFNFPTGVPGFTIPSQVGPFNVFDGRVQLNQTIFDMSSIRRARAIGAALDAASAEADAAREAAAARAADDYLAALASEGKARCAQAALEQAEATARSAQRDVDTGNASDSELNKALLEVSANKRKLSSAQNAVTQAHLQLLDDLGLDFDIGLELTDALDVDSSESVDLAAQIALALRTRAELRGAGEREAEARDESAAIHGGILPTVSVYGDMGPQNSVITHTVGISARITLFDGGLRKAQQAESEAAVRRYGIQQRDLKRKIELEVRRAFADLQAVSIDAREADSAVKIAEEELARAQRRFVSGVGNNAEVVNSEMGEIRAREEQVDARLAWNRARLALAKATGTAEAFEPRHALPSGSPAGE